MKTYLILFLTCLPIVSWGQHSYFVHDAETEESIPFVKVYPEGQQPLLADIDGRFEVPAGVKQVRITSAGYFDSTFVLSLADSILSLRPFVQDVSEVVVRPGENPAHRIMEQVIANRKENHPLGKDAFTYNAYSKFIFDINRDALAAISDTTSDSSALQMKKFFDNNHLFLIEIFAACN